MKGTLLFALQSYHNSYSWRALCVFCLATAGLVAVVFWVLGGYGIDWDQTYWPSMTAVVHGANPYTVNNFFVNPVYMVFPALPALLLGENIGLQAVRLLTIVVAFFAVRKWGGNASTWLIYFTMPSFLGLLAAGNLEFVQLIGLSIGNSALAILALIAKPQAGGGLAVLYIWWSLRQRKIARLVTVGAIFTAPFLIYGFPGEYAVSFPLHAHWNVARFWMPYNFFAAYPLLLIAVLSGNKRLAVLVSPLLGPYTNVTSIGVSLVVLSDKKWLMMLAWVISWCIVFYRVV